LWYAVNPNAAVESGQSSAKAILLLLLCRRINIMFLIGG
jgi:hypothetical protein